MKKYTNGEVTIVWRPEVCVHSGNCFHGLNEVFNPQKRPWVSPDATTSQKIVEQIKKCPSGALSYYMNSDPGADQVTRKAQETIVEPTTDGPLLVHGDLIVKDGSGVEIRKNNVTAFCRCGGSRNKPFCDGTHREIAFKS
jgi:uncharacterized Fe-S cluster protein YjdI